MRHIVWQGSRVVTENSTGMGRQGTGEWRRGPRDDEGKIIVRPWGQGLWGELACHAKAFGLYFLDSWEPWNYGIIC